MRSAIVDFNTVPTAVSFRFDYRIEFRQVDARRDIAIHIHLAANFVCESGSRRGGLTATEIAEKETDGNGMTNMWVRG